MLNKRAPFNRLPYNRPAGVLGELNAAAAFYNHLNAAVGAGKLIPTEIVAGGDLKNDVSLTHGYTHRLDGGIELHNDTVLTPSRSLGGYVGGSLAVQLHIVKDVPMPQEQGASLQAWLKVVKDLPPPKGTPDFGIDLQSQLHLTKEAPATANMGGLLNAYIDIAPLDVGVIQITTPIYAGQSVFLDTENFVLLIDDKNALHAHRGDWPQISRSTVRVEIDSGTGKLEGTLVVTPRYL